MDQADQHNEAIRQKRDLAKLPVAKGASFNSYAEEHNAQCLPNTRTDLLHDIIAWSKDKDGKAIFWLSGMAGTGKSTIARTIAQLFAKNGQLGASFFFKKGEGDRGNASRFFTTIATHLATYEEGMLAGIADALDADSAISGKSLKDQFEQLILNPLLGIQQVQSQALSRIIVIDALDECERDDDARAILRLLARTRGIQPLPLRILVTSRPELHIRLGFKEMPNGTYQDLVLHEVPRSAIEHDICLFLKHELSAIQQTRMLPSDWPTRDQVQALVELAVPLFIFAATVCRYIGTKGGDPEGYLNKVLQYKKSTYSQLDRTYLPVLDQLLNEQEEEDKDAWLQTFRELVGSIVVLESPLSVVSLARLLQIQQQQVRYRLDALHSVFSIPESKDVPIRMLHLSFREFLIDPQKQGKSPFWVDEKSIHKMLASRCLELMSKPNGLHDGMCSLSTPGVRRSDIDESSIARSLPPELQYACRYWVDHLVQSQHQIIEKNTTCLFLQKHLLNWLEAMSLLGESGRCIYLLERLQALVAVRVFVMFYYWRYTYLQRSHLTAISLTFFVMPDDLCCDSNIYSQMPPYKYTAPHLCLHQRDAQYDKPLWVKRQSGLKCCRKGRLVGTPAAACSRAIPRRSARSLFRRTANWSRRPLRTTRYEYGSPRRVRAAVY
jgi:hypothetical protein